MWFSWSSRLHMTPIILCATYSIFLPRVQRLRVTSHMLNVLAPSNSEPAQKEYVRVCRWTRMEKRWQWLTSCEIQPVPQIQLQPHSLNVYPADVAASPSSLLLIAFSTASPPHFSPLQNRKPLPPPPPPFLSSSLEVCLGMEMMSLRERNEVLRKKVCENEEHSGVIQHPPSALRPTTLQRGGSEPFHPLSPAACLPAAAQSYEMVMSLAVTSRSLNLSQ